MAEAFSDVRSFGKGVVFDFICSVRSQTQPGALAGRVESGILQKTSTRTSSIVVQDYDYTPVQIR
ncbi:hypothetical protein PQR34_43715 [Paraburkholderia sediminicola]|jgi:hypothetical protein|uniref:hypothetical protein n=1 Tax=Paraburkholderia sediminicola TaxID=458836 RepID=UPI001AADBC03